MAKIDELLKQKEDLEKEIEKEKNKEFKISNDQLAAFTYFIGEIIVPSFLDNIVPDKLKTKIDGEIFEKENKSVITLENLNTKTKYLTITIKGE